VQDLQDLDEQDGRALLPEVSLGMIRRAAALAELAGAGNLLDVGSSA
jgi:hypothetical protein